MWHAPVAIVKDGCRVETSLESWSLRCCLTSVCMVGNKTYMSGVCPPPKLHPPTINAHTPLPSLVSS